MHPWQDPALRAKLEDRRELMMKELERMAREANFHERQVRQINAELMKKRTELIDVCNQLEHMEKGT
jgi:hypothetical protein